MEKDNDVHSVFFKAALKIIIIENISYCETYVGTFTYKSLIPSVNLFSCFLVVIRLFIF